jgi:hypothetical protein
MTVHEAAAETQPAPPPSSVVAFHVIAPVVPDIWPQVEPLIASALAYAQGECTTRDVLERLSTERAALWVMLQPEGPMLGVVVAEVIAYPQQRVANAWLIAGKDADFWLPAADAALEAWARQRGCVAITGGGRRGFRPMLEKLGYRQVTVTFRKELTDE